MNAIQRGPGVELISEPTDTPTREATLAPIASLIPEDELLFNDAVSMREEDEPTRLG